MAQINDNTQALSIGTSPGYLFSRREYTEDGIEIIHTSFQVWATAPDGHRWAHDHSFKTAPATGGSEDGPDGEYYYWCPGQVTQGEIDEVEAACDALAAKVVSHVEAGGSLNADHWFGIDAAYGSDAYQALAVCDRPDVIAENRDRAECGAELIR